jgi:pimeloyl-ACP methyl ester carboxylesterase
MMANLKNWLGTRKFTSYARRPPLILVNGLAEQAESWFCNTDYWRHHFDVYTPNLLVYDGAELHRRIEDGLPITIDYLVEQLHQYLDLFVQTPPYNLAANSLGGKIAVEFATRYPDQVARLVLLCPSGLSDEERLPIVEGVRRNDLRSLIESVFLDPHHVEAGLAQYFERQFKNRRWRSGLLRTIQGTKDHRVGHLLPRVAQPTLLVVGSEDRIVNPQQTALAASVLPQGQVHVLQRCGHAPQIEKAEVINRLVVDFLTTMLPAAPRTSHPSGRGQSSEAVTNFFPQPYPNPASLP